MSTSHAVVIICDRCGERATFDPMPYLDRGYRAIGSAAPNETTLRRTASLRPPGWGEVELRRSDNKTNGEAQHLVSKTVCPECCGFLRVAITHEVEGGVEENPNG